MKCLQLACLCLLSCTTLVAGSVDRAELPRVEFVEGSSIPLSWQIVGPVHKGSALFAAIPFRSGSGGESATKSVYDTEKLASELEGLASNLTQGAATSHRFVCSGDIDLMKLFNLTYATPVFAQAYGRPKRVRLYL